MELIHYSQSLTECFKAVIQKLFQLQVFMNNLEDDGDKILDFENFVVRSFSSKYENTTTWILETF